MKPSSPVLSTPRRDRWQPLRCGLVNLYRYDDEVFEFVDGRLLIRGNNGTGKSRVLALTLPFLLDGDIDPRRVEPDRDPAKRMEWNLLLNQHADRTGYTWIEFARRGPNGDEFVTLGCGLRAVAGQGAPGRWYFITPQRIGRDLALIVGEKPGRPMTRDQLEEVIQGSGRVFRKPEEYRSEVDKKLFRLGPQRYAALLQLLIQLRQPQLARELKEETLSKALSEALSPLGDALVDDVALAFKALESERSELASFLATRNGVEEFRTDYAAYLRCAARRRAQALRSAHRHYEQVQRAIHGHEQKLVELAAKKQTAEGRQRTAQTDQIAAAARLREMENSEEIKSVRALETARRRAADAEKAAVASALSLAKAREAETGAAENFSGQTTRLEAAQKEFERGKALVKSAAERARLLDAYAMWDRLATDALTKTDVNAARRQADKALEIRRQNIVLLDGKIAALATVQDQFSDAERHFNAVSATVAALAEELAEWQRQEAATGENLLQEMTKWCKGLECLPVAFAENWTDELKRWCESHSGDAPWTSAVGEAHRQAQHRLAEESAAVKQAQAAIAIKAEELRRARDEVEAGRHAPPAPPPTRGVVRTGRPGAPLWQACDFQADVSDHEQAMIEAALEAAGLLDAWILPDGTTIDPITQDVFLSPTQLAPLPRAKSLLARLKPSGALHEATVGRLLAVIGWGEQAQATAWIDGNGRWRVGPASGAWTKDRASHVGEVQREAARQRRLSEIVAAEAALDGERAANHEKETSIATRSILLRQELERQPTVAPLLKIFTQIDVNRTTTVGKQEELRNSQSQRATQMQRRDTLRAALEQDAIDLQLPGCTSPQAIRECERQTAALQKEEVSLLHLAEAVVGAAALVQQFQVNLLKAREAAEQLDAQTRDSEAAAVAERATLEAIESKLGATEAELLERLNQAQQTASTANTELEQAKKAFTDLETEERVENRLLEEQKPQLAEKNALRNATIPPIEHLVSHRLLAELSPALAEIEAGEWSVTHAVHIARRLEEELSDVPAEEADWTRHLNEFQSKYQELQEALQPHGYRPKLERPDEGLFVVTCLFQSRTCTMSELHAALSGELATRGRLLDANERKVIENHLLGEVAAQLRDRINAAEKTVTNMNDELHSRPNSTGLRLQFKWEVVADGPAGLEAAREQLRKTTDIWSATERESLAEFLQVRINDVKSQMPEGTAWRDLLAVALDYRSWHRFHIEREQDGQWKRLTKKIYGTGSGGEKALMLTLPQVAAAAAHYRSAAPEAPRLILLDEVFVGIDNDARGKCLGLLAAFDLDVVMTSEREWGIYPTVPGLGIYQLSARAGIDGIGVVRWVWNGHEIKQIKDDETSAETPTTIQ